MGVIALLAVSAVRSWPVAIRLYERAVVSLARMPDGQGNTVLPIIFDAQDHALSCEVAALKMALAYRGVTVSEADLIRSVGTDATPKRKVNGVTVWGDPDEAFVGNIDGAMLVDGYGVYWGPIARTARAFRRAEPFQGWTPGQLAHAIQDGNPVIVWGYLWGGKQTSWQTPGGKIVRAVTREHVFVVNGFRGSADSPEGFFLVDPIYGRRYYALDEFMQRWDSLGDSGVVIY